MSDTEPQPSAPVPAPSRKKKSSRSQSGQKKYATVRHPSIEAVVEGLYQFADHNKAQERLKQIRRDFVTKKQEEGSGQEMLLWIRGFAMHEGDTQAGYRGHYAKLSVVKGKENLWTLQAERVDVPLHQHPQRERPKHNHPDWNHPILRSVKSGRIYDSYEQVAGELETLHVEFPDVTIPGKDRLHLIIYEGHKAEQFTRKYTLVLIPKEQGQFMIVAEAKSPPPPRRKLKQARAEGEPEAVGKFTAKVKGDRLRKKRK